MKKYTKEEFRKLKSTDIYSQLLFILYNIGRIPEYKTLTDLMFIFDKQTMLKLCEYFGGQTITFPTVKQLMKALRILALYESIEIDKIPYDQAVLQHKSDVDEIKGYESLMRLMNEYEVKSST